MVRFLQNFPLKKYHTFRTDVRAKYFFEFTEVEDLVDFQALNSSWITEKRIFLGGGSNILFINDFDGLVIHANLPGIKLINESRNHVWLEVGAGVNWDELVQYTVLNGWGGLENLSLIPGKVGSAPIQNIGAYGVEVKDYIEEVTGFDLEEMKLRTIPGSECNFAYRDSIFKKTLKDRFLVTNVTFCLDKFPQFELSYGDLSIELRKQGEISLQSIRNTVISIRQSKLPDPEIIGNAGSFFKNPIVSKDFGQELRLKYPTIPLYEAEADQLKLAAGWLVDQCGWKGYREGDAGVNDKQALVLVNYGSATGQQIFDLSEKIRHSVFDKFNVQLEREVNLIGL